MEVLKLLARTGDKGFSDYNDDDDEYNYSGDSYNYDYYDSESGYIVTWWMIAIIAWFSVVFLLFWFSLIFYCCRENRRKHDGQPFRANYAIWKAVCVASGLWFLIWLFKKCHCCGSDRKKGGNYSKVDGGDSPSSNNDVWYGIQAQNTAYSPYGHHGEGKFEMVQYDVSAGTEAPLPHGPTFASLPGQHLAQPTVHDSTVPTPGVIPSPDSSVNSVHPLPPPYSLGAQIAQASALIQPPPAVSHSQWSPIPPQYTSAYAAYSPYDQLSYQGRNQ